MEQCVQIGVRNIGLSIVDDITREEMLHITSDKWKVTRIVEKPLVRPCVAHEVMRIFILNVKFIFL
jgi:hypothetical protein